MIQLQQAFAEQFVLGVEVQVIGAIELIHIMPDIFKIF
jgi:hypothetical protein